MKTSLWYVLTGGPCAGKTTTLLELEKRGYPILHEPARKMIERELATGKTFEEIKTPLDVFLNRIVEEALRHETATPRDTQLFLDRGVVDSVAYYRLAGVPITKILDNAGRSAPYKKVFLFDLVDFKTDHVRQETPEEAARIHEGLAQAYTDYGFDVLRVPVMRVVERADFVLAHL